MVTSRINPRLLQPYASVEGLVVGVYTVPVTVTEGATYINPCVAEGSGEGRANGVLVARGLGVGSGVFVAGGTNAVCVRKKDADRVPMLWVSRALISGVGEAGGCPPQEINRALISSIRRITFPDFFIFTSM